MGSADGEEHAGSQTEGTRDLVRRVRAGELDRFRELYERLAPSLHAWARIRSSPAQNQALDPDDLLQEVWTRAIERLPSYDESRASFRAWIFGIAKNVGFDAWTRGHGALRQVSSSDFDGLESWPDVATSIRSRLAKDESAGMLMEEVSRLDPVDRMLVIHCGMEDTPCSTVAPRLGISVDSALKRWQRLRVRLRNQAFSTLLEV